MITALVTLLTLLCLPLFAHAQLSTQAQRTLEAMMCRDGRMCKLTMQGTGAPALSSAGQGIIYYDTATNTFQASQNGGAYVTLVGAGGSAPANATYIVQTAHAGLSAEQALSSLATGYAKVTTGTGAITSQAVPIPLADGGTGLTAGTSGGILGYTATGTLASSALLTANALMLGGGAGATPTVLGSLGTTTTVLHGNAAGAPTFAAVSLTADVSGTLPGANGGTGNAFFAVSGPTTSLKTFTFPDASSTVTTGTGTSGRVMVWGAANVAADSNYILSGATAARTYTFPDANSTIVTLDATQTLTAKTLTSPVLGGTVTGTYTLGGTPTVAANLLFTDNTYDIGASGATRPRNLFLSGDATIGDQLIVSGVGPHALGGATNADTQLYLRGSFTGTGAGQRSLLVESTLTAGADSGSLYGIEVTTTFTERAAGTHPLLAGIRVSPTVTAGVAATTTLAGIAVQTLTAPTGTVNAASIYVSDAPTGATNNYALWSAAGLNRFDGNIVMLAGTDIRPTADSATALNIANAAGTDFVTFDTTNSRVGIGTAAPGAPLSIAGGTAGNGVTTQALLWPTRLSFQQTSGDQVSAGQIDYGLLDTSALSIVGKGTSATNRGVRIFDALGIGYSPNSTNGALLVNGNVGIGTTVFGTSAAGVLAQGIGTAPTTSPADVVQMWAADINAVAGQAGWHIRDELGGIYKIGAGIMWASGSKPACAVGIRGTVYYVAGGAGVLDTFEVCRKAADDTYAWITLF